MSTPALQQECPVPSDINILENTQIQNDCQNEKYNHQNFRPFFQISFHGTSFISTPITLRSTCDGTETLGFALLKQYQHGSYDT